MDPYSNTAVCVRNATKSFGKKKKPVLDNLNMHVEKGIIYGLLGASGCGKTTLLNCIVGRKNLDSGSVWVLGGPPGTSGSGIPGPRVGYMPQEVALVAEFTVRSAIYYFGRIFCMADKEIEDRFNYLTDLLDLPPGDRIIANCSGGQQRRVSFAAALVSKPELLILDEPTVGLDPVLRESIWKYLLQITEKHQSSVIITTHYIEETRQAHRVGMMRHGKLLVENTPENLLREFDTNTLEDVFLTLSRQQAQGTLTENNLVTGSNMIEAHSNSTMVLSDLVNSHELLTPKTETKEYKKTASNAYGLNPYRLKALFIKSWLQITRNLSGVSFMLVFPVFEILAFFLAVGDDVKHIKIATINQEDHFGGACGGYMRSNSAFPLDEGGCRFQHLGCRFLELLQDPMIDPVYYDDVDKAKIAITHGDVTGALFIPENFSIAFQEKLIEGNFENDVLNYSQIQVWLDMSNRQIGAAVQVKLVDKIVEFQKALFSDCHFLSKLGAIPINFDEHVYGRLNDTFLVFMAPGVLMTIIFFLATINATTVMITDRLEGIWDRSIVVGISSLEIVLVHFVTQVIIMTVQAIIVLIVAFPIYKTEYNGDFITIAVIILLEGVVGITFGFFISILSNSHSMANFAATGSFYPMLVLCGLMWPLEGMPQGLRWISLVLPFTLPISALRNVIKKGWSILHASVITGVGVQLFYIIIFAVISTLVLKKRR